MAPSETPRARLTVDLDAIAENYRRCVRLSGGAAVSAVVKADAYGLGERRVSETLRRAGCADFFVATFEEGAASRKSLEESLGERGNEARIYLLNGLPPGAAALCREARLIPCLGSLEEIAEWRALCREAGEILPSVWHLDSGMNRLGLDAASARHLEENPDHAEARPIHVMSHFACAEIEDHPMNWAQIRRFDATRRRLALTDIPASMANSAALLRGVGLYEMTRPGVGLYGGDPRLLGEKPEAFRPVARLEGVLAQIRAVPAGETVGYGAGFEAREDMRVGVAQIGYADGVHRGAWRADAETPPLRVRLRGGDAPIIGQVSMDMITIDLSHLPESAARRGERVEFLGEETTINDLARSARTIPHAILTALRFGTLGKRVSRVYKAS